MKITTEVKKMQKLTILILGLAILAGGARAENAYKKYYVNKTPFANVKESPLYIPSSEPIKVIQYNDAKQDLNAYLRKGYQLIGTSDFNANSRRVSNDDLLKQAERVGAQIVLAKSQYTGSTTTNSTFITNSKFGIIGSAIPITNVREDFGAMYLAKFKTRLGIGLTELSDEDRKKIEQNGGVKVSFITDESPTYIANILADDIIVSLNGVPVTNVSNFGERIKVLPNGIAKFEIIRDGKRIIKEVNVGDAL